MSYLVKLDTFCTIYPCYDVEQQKHIQSLFSIWLWICDFEYHITPFQTHIWKLPGIYFNHSFVNVGLKYYSSQTIEEGELSDSEFLSHLVEILKTSSPVLQTKAASILEFLTGFDTCREKIISLDIESALDSLFQHKFFKGNCFSGLVYISGSIKQKL